MEPHHYKEQHLNSSLNHSQPSTLLSHHIPENSLVLKSPGSKEIQSILNIPLNAKNLVIICGMIKSTLSKLYAQDILLDLTYSRSRCIYS
jgi:hypothetical protein